MRKSFTTVARVRYIFFLCIAYCLYVSACVACMCNAFVREQMGDEVKGGRTASRVPKASTFCYAIGRSWRWDSIKRRTRHHGRPINPQTKVDYDFSRGHRSRLLLRPVHTHERVHRFFLARRVHWANLNIERVATSYYVLLLLSTARFLFLSQFFIFLF